MLQVRVTVFQNVKLQKQSNMLCFLVNFQLWKVLYFKVEHKSSMNNFKIYILGILKTMIITTINGKIFSIPIIYQKLYLFFGRLINVNWKIGKLLVNRKQIIHLVFNFYFGWNCIYIRDIFENSKIFSLI